MRNYPTVHHTLSLQNVGDRARVVCLTHHKRSRKADNNEYLNRWIDHHCHWFDDHTAEWAAA